MHKFLQVCFITNKPGSTITCVYLLCFFYTFPFAFLGDLWHTSSKHERYLPSTFEVLELLGDILLLQTHRCSYEDTMCFNQTQTESNSFKYIMFCAIRCCLCVVSRLLLLYSLNCTCVYIFVVFLYQLSIIEIMYIHVYKWVSVAI